MIMLLNLLIFGFLFIKKAEHLYRYLPNKFEFDEQVIHKFAKNSQNFPSTEQMNM